MIDDTTHKIRISERKLEKLDTLFKFTFMECTIFSIVAFAISVTILKHYEISFNMVDLILTILPFSITIMIILLSIVYFKIRKLRNNIKRLKVISEL